MRTRKPIDRYDLRIKRNDRVLEVGSGNNPNYRSNVLVEKYVSDNTHRRGDTKIYAHQHLICADGTNMPFDDKEFDYIICNQVAEHVADPEVFMRELSRVANAGYLETPSLIGEFLFPKAAHRWAILDIDNKLIFFEKKRMKGNYLLDYGEVFLNYLPYQSLFYKLLWFTHDGDLMLNRYEWKNEIDFEVNPTDPYYSSFFLDPWTPEMARKIFPQRSVGCELKNSLHAFNYMIRQKIKHRFVPHIPMSVETYYAQQMDLQLRK